LVRVSLAVDELQITGALSIAVTGTVLGTGLVALVLGHTTVLVHGDEVQGAVETAAELRHIDIEGELVAQQREHLVLVLAIQEVETRSDVGGCERCFSKEELTGFTSLYGLLLTVVSLGDELQGQGVAACRCTVGTLVFGPVDGAVFGTRVGIGADGAVPLVAGIAIGVATDVVEPAPVGIDGDLTLDGLAAAGSRAFLPGHLGMSLSRLAADCLPRDSVGGCPGRHDGSCSRVHHFVDLKK